MNGFDLSFERGNWSSATRTRDVDELESLELFAALGRRRLRKLARASEVAEFVPGDVVAGGEEQAAPFFHVILDGAAEVKGAGGRRRLRRGGHFGGSALIGGTRPGTVVATDELRLLRVPRPAFLELARENPTVALAVLRELAEPTAAHSRAA
jgi:signal-transduction protein with cAMP-binding, CBS, and nucleotidyltransferase domain